MANEQRLNLKTAAAGVLAIKGAVASNSEAIANVMK